MLMHIYLYIQVFVDDLSVSVKAQCAQFSVKMVLSRIPSASLPLMAIRRTNVAGGRSLCSMLRGKGLI